MSKWLLAVGVFALAGCNKNQGDSGKTAEIPADCDDYMSALADCYAVGGFELADGGIDAEAWCADFEESGESSDIFECYVELVEAGDCTTSQGISEVSASLSACDED